MFFTHGDLEGSFLREKEFLLSSIEKMPVPYRKFLAAHYPDAHVRRAYLESIGVIFEDDSSFANMGFIVVPNSLDDVHVRVGKHVSIAPNVTCVCDSSANNGQEINKYSYIMNRLTKKADITIEDEAWVGAGVTILPGVTISRCAVIGAGCVMNKDAEPYGIYAGVPGKKIGDIRQGENGFES